MRILERKFYAYKSKNRRKNTPDSAFPRTLYIYIYSTAQVKEPIFFFISRTNFTIRDFPPSGLE